MPKRLEFIFTTIRDDADVVLGSPVCCDNLMLALEANHPFSRGKLYCTSCSTVFADIVTIRGKEK